MEPHLIKIKLLLALTKSPNIHEAENARVMADKLIEKHNVTQKQLDSLKERDPTSVPEEQLLFKTQEHCEWKSILAYLISVKYECYVMQIQTVGSAGYQEYDYFVFGDIDNIDNVKFLFPLFVNKINDLVSRTCKDKEETYTSSYCEGLVNGLRPLLENESFKVPKAKSKEKEIVKEAEQPGLIRTDSITNPAEKPTDKKVAVNSNDKVKDVIAYFHGVRDSDQIHFYNILE